MVVYPPETLYKHESAQNTLPESDIVNKGIQ